MTNLLPILIFCVLLISCDNKQAATDVPSVNIPSEVAEFQSTKLDSNQITTSNEHAFPIAAAQSEVIRILPTGTFHGDEVEEGVDALPWLGLFTSDDGTFFLKTTQITAVRVVDGLLDNEDNDEMTGWEIQTQSGEYPTILVSGGDFTEGRIDGAETPSTLYPGDSSKFVFKGVQYVLYATGSREFDSLYATSYVTDYSLYIVRTHNGESRTSMLVSHGNFDETMTSILWSGDLDRDGYIDFLIDMSRHYNQTLPTLFLSKPAGPDEVAVPVADHSSVGC